MRSTIYITLACSLLAGCAAKRVAVVDHPVPVEVSIPVATGCVAAQGRPAPVAPLNQQIPEAEWMARTASARAAAIQAQAGRRMNYEDLDRAATLACK